MTKTNEDSAQWTGIFDLEQCCSELGATETVSNGPKVATIVHWSFHIGLVSLSLWGLIVAYYAELTYSQHRRLTLDLLYPHFELRSRSPNWWRKFPGIIFCLAVLTTGLLIAAVTMHYRFCYSESTSQRSLTGWWWLLTILSVVPYTVEMFIVFIGGERVVQRLHRD